MEKRIELWVFPTGNVAVYRGSAFIPTEQLTEEERLFVLNRVCDELKGKDLDVEIKKYTEEKYHETFGNGQGTLDEFDWEDIAQTIEETAHHFTNWQKEQQPHWKPSEEQIIDKCPLQQEQPEVDLEEEVRKYCGSSFRFNYDELNDSFYSNTFEFDDVVELARYFYELGLNARKED